ncbi:MAG: molybdopterin-dependent oxidoreductase [Thermodesulfobacteriota bacterium]
MNRRQFLYLLSGLPLIGPLFRIKGLFKYPEHVISPVFTPENYVPGIASWYPTVCQQCPAGCGILVKVREGRAKKIEGNPDYPVNMGKTCARGQAGLQLLYNPDRVQGPMKLVGPRGRGQYQPLDWDEALNLVADRLKRLQSRNQPDRFIFLTNLLRGHEQTLVTSFMQAFGLSSSFPLRLS